MAVKIGKDVVALTHRAQCYNKNIFSRTGGAGPEEQGVVFPVIWGLGLCLVFAVSLVLNKSGQV